MDNSKITCEAVQSMLAENLSFDLSPAEREHLSECNDCTEWLVVQLLREAPEALIPPGFAARVRSRASRVSEDTARSPVHRPAPSFGFLTAVVVLLLAVLLWVALSFFDPQQWVFGGGLTSVLIFCTLGTEIGGIGLWLGLRSFAG